MKAFFGAVACVALLLLVPAANADDKRNIGSTTGPGLVGVDTVEVSVENYSSQDYNVVVYYNGGKASADPRFGIVTEGWWVVKPTGRATFKFPADSDAYLRVQGANGVEYRWQGLDTYLNGYVATGKAFTVFYPYDDTPIRTLQSGGTVTNIRDGDKAPAGWKLSRFFRVGTSPLVLRIEP